MQSETSTNLCKHSRVLREQPPEQLYSNFDGNLGLGQRLVLLFTVEMINSTLKILVIFDTCNFFVILRNFNTINLRSWRDFPRECFCRGGGDAGNASREAVRGFVRSRLRRSRISPRYNSVFISVRKYNDVFVTKNELPANPINTG